ncbi:MAG: phosphoribosylformylglycinamidine synthase II, partial [Chloroflexi bacterium]|nr:phosphoribosylformylglycinamidine synthase II [Chloroflexota bacterium]
AHDLSDGGLAVALAECCILGRIGARAIRPSDVQRWDATLFGEAPARVLVSVSPDSWQTFEGLAAQFRVPLWGLGTVGGDRLRMAGVLEVPVAEMEQAWSGALLGALRGAAPA